MGVMRGIANGLPRMSTAPKSRQDTCPLSQDTCPLSLEARILVVTSICAVKLYAQDDKYSNHVFFLSSRLFPPPPTHPDEKNVQEARSSNRLN